MADLPKDRTTIRVAGPSGAETLEEDLIGRVHQSVRRRGRVEAGRGEVTRVVKHPSGNERYQRYADKPDQRSGDGFEDECEDDAGDLRVPPPVGRPTRKPTVPH